MDVGRPRGGPRIRAGVEDDAMNTPDTPQGGTVRIDTDIALIALFDPDLLREHVKEPRRWWEADPFGTAERQDGRMALWPLGGRGGLYRVRLGAELSELERPYDRGAAAPAPLVVGPNGLVFLGPAERLPGDGFGDRYPGIPDKGGLLPLAPGKYAVTAHALDWRPEARFWNEDNEPTPDAPPDFVLVFEPVEALPPAEPEVKPLLEHLPQKKPKGGERVVTPAVRPRNPIVLDDEKPQRRARGASTGAAPRSTATRTRAEPIKVVTGKPGELREGARVRHPTYGVGTVLFIRDGFPKARVAFDARSEEYKVDKSELTVLS